VSAGRLLIVDDNAINLKLVRLLLAGAGYEVRTAASAADALAVLGDYRPQLILMDLQLPDMDGLEVTRRIKARPELVGIPVLALTAYAMKGDDERAHQAGCDGYITKPIDTRTLPALIAGYLDGNH
jgi:CheY-like chemotaxis protein